MDSDNVICNNQKTNAAMGTSNTTDSDTGRHADSSLTQLQHHKLQLKHIHLLPPEIQSLITTHLSQHDLTVCVLVSQTWFALFSPALWKTIKPYPSQSYNWGIPQPEIWFYRFCASVDAGALVRNGHLVRSFSTKYHSVIDFLWVLGRIAGGGLGAKATKGMCTELRELTVESEANPYVPEPSQDLSAFYTSTTNAFGRGKKAGFGRKKHAVGSSGALGRPTDGGGVIIGENVAFGGGVVVGGHVAINGGNLGGSGQSLETGQGFGNITSGIPSTTLSTFTASSIGQGAFENIQSALFPPLPSITAVGTGEGAGIAPTQQGVISTTTTNTSIITPITTAPTAPAAATAAGSFSSTNAFSGFGSFNRLAATAPIPSITRRRLGNPPSISLTKTSTLTTSFGSTAATSNDNCSTQKPFVFGSGATTKSMPFADVYGPGVRDFKVYPLACLSSGDSPVRSKAALIWLLRRNPQLKNLSIKGSQFLYDYFNCETTASSTALGVEEATVAGVLAAIPKSVRMLTLHYQGAPTARPGAFRQHPFRRPHPSRLGDVFIGVGSSSSMGDGATAAQIHRQQQQLNLPVLDSLEWLVLLGSPLQNSLSYILFNRLPVLRTLWIEFNDDTIAAFFPCDSHGDNDKENNFAQTLWKGCPQLVDLIIEGSITDGQLALLLSGASTRGWRTLIFKSKHNILGPESVNTILEHAAPSLETIRFDHSGPGFKSQDVQQLLCTAPNLIRFVGLVGDRAWEKDVELNAGDVFGGRNLIKKNWACLSLETFKCKIVGIPRPDITTRTNGRPLTDHPLHSEKIYTLEDSYRIQRQVYAQLGRLHKLMDLSLGSDYFFAQEKGDFDSDDDFERATNLRRVERESEGQYFSMEALQVGYQNECLSMTLASGMGLMSGLKNLRSVELDGMQVEGGFTWPALNRDWIRNSWPKWRAERYWDPFWEQFGYKKKDIEFKFV